MQDVFRHHLHHQCALAEAGRDIGEVVRAARQHLVGHVDAVTAQQCLGLVFEQVAILVAGVGECGLQFRLRRGRRHDLLVVAGGEEDAPLAECRDYPYRIFQRRVDR